MQVNKERLINQFLELININSPSCRERNLADYLKEKLISLDLAVNEDNVGEEFGGDTGNLICTYQGDDNLPTILLTAHMDTVKATAGINLIVEEGLIKTDGTTILGGDDKVGIAAILEAIHILKESEIKHGNLEIIFTSGEEAGLFGAKYLNIKSLESKLGFVFDSGGPVGRIIVSAPTEKDFDIEVKGRAAHAGVEPEKGISAIEVGSDIINQLNLGRIDEETTANIGIIEGGEATNIVADRLYIKGEARSRNTDKLDNLLKEIKKVCKEKESKWGVEVELIIQKAYSGFDLTRRDKVVKIAMEAIKGLGLEAKLRPRGGGSDANIFNARGIPTVNLGIGVENDHTTKERIAIDDLVNCASLAVEVIKNIGK